MIAQDILLQKYGQPGPSYINEFCTIWEIEAEFPWFPVKRFLVNMDFMELLRLAFTKLTANNLHNEIMSFNGCYNDMAVRGANRKTIFSWAAAIRLNEEENKSVVNPMPQQRQGRWSLRFINVMKETGIYFGGDFEKRASPAYFSLVDG